jgi:hypothetical protein
VKRYWKAAFALVVVAAGLWTAVEVWGQLLGQDTVGGVLAYLDTHTGCWR